jgi:hypothetical protein
MQRLRSIVGRILAGLDSTQDTQDLSPLFIFLLISYLSLFLLLVCRHVLY